MDNPSLNTPGTNPAFDIAEVKAHLRISTSADDTELTYLCQAAVDAIQSYCGRCLITSTWIWVLDSFGARGRRADDDFWFQRYPTGERVSAVLEVPIKPLVSVQSIIYVDDAGNQQTLGTDQYQIDARRGRLAPAVNTTWPTTQRDRLNAVTINFTAGYGDTKASIPAKMRHALFMLVGHWNENRENTSTFTIKDVPLGFLDVLDEFRVWRF